MKEKNIFSTLSGLISVILLSQIAYFSLVHTWEAYPVYLVNWSLYQIFIGIFAIYYTVRYWKKKNFIFKELAGFIVFTTIYYVFMFTISNIYGDNMRRSVCQNTTYSSDDNIFSKNTTHYRKVNPFFAKEKRDFSDCIER